MCERVVCPKDMEVASRTPSSSCLHTAFSNWTKGLVCEMDEGTTKKRTATNGHGVDHNERHKQRAEYDDGRHARIHTERSR
mmetsp:Transcript_7954/g.19917  ORF Transcript_7954/g.19917 Transcript_7954/m.19917 type:complete len:81 (-) Transcript_7954:137-379(-)